MAPNKARYHIDRLVADLIGTLDALEVDKVRLVGHDRGSAICWHTCLRHPGRIDRYAALSVGHPGAYAHGGLNQKLKSYDTCSSRFLGSRRSRSLPLLVALAPDDAARPGDADLEGRLVRPAG